MVCHVCGRAVLPEDRFCNRCGTALRAVEPVQADPPASDQVVPSASVQADPSAAGQAEPADADDGIDVADDPASEPVPSAATVADPTQSDSTRPATTPVDARTELVPVVDGDDEWGETDPVWAPTAATAVVEAGSTATATSDLPATEPITEVWMERVSADVHATSELTVADTAGAPSTAEMPAIVEPAAPPPRVRFRFGAVTLIGIITGVVTLAAVFATLLTIESTTRLTLGPETPIGFRTGSWIVDDLAGNLSIAGLVAIVSMVAGGVAAGFGWRWGSGLAGGAGLAVAGLATIAIGLAQAPIDAAHEFVLIPSDQPFTLTITRDLGYWLLVAAGALGVVLFFASINDAFGDRRPGLNPWIAALGALATVVATAGPLLPENLAVFSDNWYLTEGPGQPSALLMVGRLVQLGAFALTGVVGYLSVRRWGLGVAVGGALPVVWLALSTLFDLTDSPVGPGYRNPGADDIHLHGVTIIGMSAVAALAILAVIAAYDQGVRERR